MGGDDAAFDEWARLFRRADRRFMFRVWLATFFTHDRLVEALIGMTPCTWPGVGIDPVEALIVLERQKPDRSWPEG